MRHAAPTLITTVLLTILAGMPAAASDGAIPLWQPTTITEPGDYVVTRDITAAGTVLDVRATSVSIDLNGHALESTDAGSPTVVFTTMGGGGGSTASSHSDYLSIFGGLIHGGLYGIQLTGADPGHLRLHDLTVQDTVEAGVMASPLGSLEAKGIIIVETKVALDLHGMSPGPPDRSMLITDSNFQADVGIRCADVSCNIADNAFWSCGSAVSLVASDGSQVAGNTIISPAVARCFNPQPEPPGRGIWIESSAGVSVVDNDIYGFNPQPEPPGRDGVHVDDVSRDVLVMRNAITGFTGDGVRLLGAHCTIRENQINHNLGNGIFVDGGQNVLDRNRVSDNTGDGIHFATADHVYRGNILLWNASGVAGAGLSDTIDGGGNIY